MGGIVFRVVTPAYPGDPSLDLAGAPIIRTEYLANDKEPWTWVLTKGEAFVFMHHLDAENAAKLISPRCHASTVRPPDEGFLPERLQPLPEPVARAVITPRRRKIAPARIDHFRAAQCRRDPHDDDDDVPAFAQGYVAARPSGEEAE